MPFFATMPTTMIMPTIDETLSAVPVAHRLSRLPDSARLLPMTMAMTAAIDPNSTNSSAPTQATEAKKTSQQLGEGFLLAGVQATVLERDARRQHELAAQHILHRARRRSEVAPLEAGRDPHQLAQVLARVLHGQGPGVEMRDRPQAAPAGPAAPPTSARRRCRAGCESDRGSAGATESRGRPPAPDRPTCR